MKSKKQLLILHFEGLCFSLKDPDEVKKAALLLAQNFTLANSQSRVFEVNALGIYNACLSDSSSGPGNGVFGPGADTLCGAYPFITPPGASTFTGSIPIPLFAFSRFCYISEMFYDDL
ncbi:hypothetical protein K435DRAFT_805770 [Dendrothele bispora CBS 962.96]|uniref:Uncharacterized protein n=1 Tax=Dendrothele bispora (strain CBS 962.96) TaxID=1314807 RepID=A0A4S8LBA3_DENBC|nr:hypothetical protein K435DRAFT_805770 [Dendrothele bispora CBS 962.96]